MEALKKKMPWVVSAIGVFSFIAGMASSSGRWVSAGFLIATVTGLSLGLRYLVESSIEQAFEKGAGFGISTRRRIRALPEAHDVPAIAKEKWLS